LELQHAHEFSHCMISLSLFCNFELLHLCLVQISARALLQKAHVVPDLEWRIQDFGKTHVPDLEWRINDFSSLLETRAESARSDTFHYSGYNWYAP
jgi:hypothetical protein